ncbi:centrosomal protein of 70 kDa [Anomaloglossus baeobatrachus]|uniref:centrosomal protein of 70 kDa n=1 Tax=Anomaloglossus baeobatrachus TaxID=238106 RepID=UPI003F4F977E
MEKILTHNNLRYRGVTAGKEAEPDTGVKGVELLPHGECQRYLQHVCRELGVQDVKNLLAVAAVRVREAGTCCALQKILSAISGVISGPRAPPLLYKHSSRLQETRGPDILDESHFLHLPPTIELWAGELRALQMLHRSLRKLNVTLQPQLQGDRTEEAAGAGVRVQELLLLVDTMVEDVENQRQGSSSDSPQVLQALVSHFQKLFDVSSLSGVFPRMNEVYTKVGEMGNALKTLRCLLGLGATARAEVVVSAVGRLCREMDGGGCRLPQMLSTLDIDSVINKVQEHEEFFPAFEELIRDLLDVLEITHLEEILPEVRRLKQLEMQGLVLLES